MRLLRALWRHSERLRALIHLFFLDWEMSRRRTRWGLESEKYLSFMGDGYSTLHQRLRQEEAEMRHKQSITCRMCDKPRHDGSACEDDIDNYRKQNKED